VSAAALKDWQRHAWGAAPFEPLAETCAPVHDALVAALDLRAGERLLDVATGTGAVALRAARIGALVTGIDLAPEMVRTARRLAERAGVRIRFDVGDAERLPYRRASFDIVASAQGVMFALDAAAAARELARVCRPGGRLGLSVLGPTPANKAFFGAWRAFAQQPPGVDDPLDWGRPAVLERLLGPSFELDVEPLVAPLEAESAEALWELQRSCCGPLKLLFGSLSLAGREALRASVIHYYERYRTARGVSAPRDFMLVTGRRLD
jgi:ubiquinone/menaquinone biosynthesis C-methylase UbiE